MGEPVLSVGISATSRYMVTGDSAGICKTWDIAALMNSWAAHGCDTRPSEDSIVPVATWRAHSRSISSLCALGSEEELFMSSSLDCTVAVWHVSGAHVGTFGTVRRRGEGASLLICALICAALMPKPQLHTRWPVVAVLAAGMRIQKLMPHVRHVWRC